MQFTTYKPNACKILRMLSTNQRYKIECNSQRELRKQEKNNKCCLQIKDTKLNAIHNVLTKLYYAWTNVVYKSKIQN